MICWSTFLISHVANFPQGLWRISHITGILLLENEARIGSVQFFNWVFIHISRGLSDTYCSVTFVQAKHVTLYTWFHLTHNMMQRQLINLCQVSTDNSALSKETLAQWAYSILKTSNHVSDIQCK